LYVSEIGGWKRILTLLIVVVLGFLSKESMVVFFPLALLIDIFRWKEYGAGEKSVRKKILGVFAGMTFLFVILKFTALSFTGNLGLSYESNIYTDNLHVRIFTFISVLVEYVKLIFWPLELYFEKGKGLFGSLATLQGFLGVIIVVGGLVAAALSFRKKKVFFLAYLWFFINLAPVSGLVPQNAMYAEHWLYLTIIGVLILFAALYDSLESGFWKKVFVVGLCVISVLFIIRDVDRSRQWADPFAFFENELQYSEAPHEIHNKVGTLYFEQEDYASAMVEFEKGINLSDTNAEARFNMCLSYYLTGKLGAALSNCERAVQIDPELSNSYMLLYNIYVMTENLERAENVMKILNSMEVTLPNQ
jgi:hypothetical protein